jgi:hypothetical protein
MTQKYRKLSISWLNQNIPKFGIFGLKICIPSGDPALNEQQGDQIGRIFAQICPNA